MSGTKNGKPVICWDSCLYIGRFREEADKPLEHFNEYIRDVENGEMLMLLPVIVVAEVLNLSDKRERDELRQFSRRRHVLTIDTTYQIAELAAMIREERGAVLGDNGQPAKGLKAPDALILASAVIYKASRLLTFDPVLKEIGAQSALIGELKVGYEPHPRLVERDIKAIQEAEAARLPLFSRLEDPT